jgi:predicted DNA-binding protein (MmcQ/YjbR family)
MNIEAFREYCLSLPGTTEGLPFDDKTLVFYVMDKMFALTDIDAFESINLKCNPEEAIMLREEYPAVVPGYHMNKKHWNTVKMDGSIKNELIKKWIKKSYMLVIANLPKNKRNELMKRI